MYPDGYYANERLFRVFPSVVRAGAESTLTVVSDMASHPLLDDMVYEVRFVPKDGRENEDERTFREFGFEDICPMQEVTVQNGKIVLHYTFTGEQEWLIYLKKKEDASAVEWFWGESMPKTRVRLSVYSLSEELYGLLPMKGDLHIHTLRSDGMDSPELTVAGYRGAGYDFLSFTDHRVYNDAKAVTDFFSFAKPMHILPAEEVHEKSEAVIHMVSLGGKYCVSDRIADSEYMQKRLAEAAEKYAVPEGLSKTEYLYRAVVYEEIQKSGGFAILPHPLWRLPERYNSNLSMSRAVLENDLTDGFELLGGIDAEGNNLQLALWSEMRAKGKSLPIVGSSDSHGMIHGVTSFSEVFTICFVDAENNIIKSISDGKSVAVECIKGEKQRIYGDFSLAKYAHFLRRCYFPRHDALCRASGTLLWEYVTGDFSLANAIRDIEEKIRTYEKGFFGL